MDSAYIAWIIAMIIFLTIVVILDDCQWCREKHKRRIPIEEHLQQ
jgi:hypothetical protein